MSISLDEAADKLVESLLDDRNPDVLHTRARAALAAVRKEAFEQAAVAVSSLPRRADVVGDVSAARDLAAALRALAEAS